MASDAGADAETLVTALVASLGRVAEGLDGLTARLVRLEATANVHVALHTALIRSHADPQVLREAWLQLSSVMLAHAALHDGEQDARRRFAHVAQDTVQHVTDLIDEVFAADRDQR